MKILSFVMFCLILTSCNEEGSYTLYRDSIIPVDSETAEGVRIHVASFDSSEGSEYNRSNCETAKSLFQNQPEVVVKYWCEKGRYKK